MLDPRMRQRNLEIDGRSSQEEKVEYKVERYRSKVEECRDHTPGLPHASVNMTRTEGALQTTHLSICKSRLEAKI